MGEDYDTFAATARDREKRCQILANDSFDEDHDRIVLLKPYHVIGAHRHDFDVLMENLRGRLLGSPPEVEQTVE